MPNPATPHTRVAAHTGSGPSAPNSSATPSATRSRPRRTTRRGPDAMDPPLLHPRRRGPGDRGEGERDAGHPRVLVADVLQGERHVGVRAEEREGEHPLHRDGGGDARGQPQRARGHQADERADGQRRADEHQCHRDADRRPAERHEHRRHPGDEREGRRRAARSARRRIRRRDRRRHRAGERREGDAPRPARRTGAARGRRPASRWCGRCRCWQRGRSAPGTTQAVENTAKTRGRSGPG